MPFYIQGISIHGNFVEDIKMKKFLAALLILLLVCSVCSLAACSKEDEDIEGAITNYTETTSYEIKDSYGKILGTVFYKAKGTDYAIITGYTPRVAGLHSIIIPEVLPGSERTVIEIGDEAFSACTSLVSVTLPDTIEAIGDWAFSLCSSMYQVNLPANVETIGKGAFVGCESLTEVNFATEKSLLIEIGDYAFNDCSSLVNITLPEGLIVLGESAFFECSALKTATLPESLTTVGRTAFAVCEALETLTLGSNIESIGEYAFGTLTSDKPEVLVYEAGSTTDKTINKVVDECPETNEK